MTIQPSDSAAPSPGRLSAWGRSQFRRTPFWITLLILAVFWAVVLAFRWELRAQWWAHQTIQADSPAERDFYITRLASIRDKSLGAVDSLLEDDRPEIRESAVHVLRFCDSSAAADRLIALLTDPSPEVSELAAARLAWRSDSAQYLPRLERMLAEEKGMRAWGVVVALGRLRPDRAEQCLREALERPLIPDVKAQIIDSLGMRGCEDAVPQFMNALADDRPLTVLPQSQLSAQHAISALSPELLARGASIEEAMQAASTPPTVSGVAARWIRLLAGRSAETVTSRPADQRDEAIHRLEQEWIRERKKSRSQPASF